MKKSKIISVASEVPSKKIHNNDFTKMGLDTNDEWIRSRTGIETRYICDQEKNESILSLSSNAAQRAILKAKLSPNDIDMVIAATSTPPESAFPSLAARVQAECQIKMGPAFDISAACSGFNYALFTAEQFIATSQAKHILIVAADELSKLIDWKDRSTCVLFGDAATAVIVSQSEEQGILYSKIYANGKQAHILTGDTKNKISMDGKQVFKNVLNVSLPAINEALAHCKLTLDDITFVIPHQANQRIMDKLKEKLNLKNSQLISIINKYGNTSAASIPLALDKSLEKNKIKKNDILLMIGFGAGFTWGLNLVKWLA